MLPEGQLTPTQAHARAQFLKIKKKLNTNNYIVVLAVKT